MKNIPEWTVKVFVRIGYAFAEAIKAIASTPLSALLFFLMLMLFILALIHLGGVTT